MKTRVTKEAITVQFRKFVLLETIFLTSKDTRNSLTGTNEKLWNSWGGIHTQPFHNTASYSFSDSYSSCVAVSVVTHCLELLQCWHKFSQRNQYTRLNPFIAQFCLLQKTLNIDFQYMSNMWDNIDTIQFLQLLCLRCRNNRDGFSLF
jgi:hypothetical protein